VAVPRKPLNFSYYTASQIEVCKQAFIEHTSAITHKVEPQYKWKTIGFVHKILLQNEFSYNENICCKQMNITLISHFYGLRKKKATGSLKSVTIQV
jgi:hypothetical protein